MPTTRTTKNNTTAKAETTPKAKATKERKPTMKKLPTPNKENLINYNNPTPTYNIPDEDPKPTTQLITAYLIQVLTPNKPKAYINSEGKQKLYYKNTTQADGLIYKDIIISQGYQLLFKTTTGDHFIIHINTYEETSKAGNTYRSANIFLSNAINQLNPDKHLYLDNDQELTDTQVKALINKLHKKPINFSKTPVSGKDYYNYRIEQPAPEALPFKLI